MSDNLTLFPTGWLDYQLIDTGEGQKLEQFGHYTIIRPETQATWPRDPNQSAWSVADAIFTKTQRDQGIWQTPRPVPASWLTQWADLPLETRLAPFKHTGIFPEQSAHWLWMQQLLKMAPMLQAVQPIEPIVGEPSNSPREKTWSNVNPHRPRILNLFAYTGAASMVCVMAGAQVTHVDASRSAIGWAKKNQLVAGLDPFSIRWILDDVTKFVTREVKRGSSYDAIILDPPAFGHGAHGERWEFTRSLPALLNLCQQLLSDQPLFVLLNAYAVNISAERLTSMLAPMVKKFHGRIEQGELALIDQRQHQLSTGVFSRWQYQPV